MPIGCVIGTRICGENAGMPIGCVIGTRICGENAGMPISCVIGTRISADHFVNTDLNGFVAEKQGCRLVVLLERGFDGSLRERGFERICGGNAGMPIGSVIGTRI